ncbi:MAG TPA: aconitase family protein, partial [Thermoplasmata archaeon]|nr:aconitase family protein [Thermoplasmata archaeon]
MLMSGLMTKLIKSGVRELEVACGPCIGMGFAPPTKGASVRTFNRNFEGRSGTLDDQVYLCSPETAAATAVNGTIMDPRDLGQLPVLKEPTKYPVDTSGYEWPPKDRTSVQVIRGPNIAPLPVAVPPVDTIEGEVLIRLGDNISTDHIMPAGAKFLPLRSNIPAIAEHVFEYVDPTFPSRAKKAGGGFIVAGDNYGQGSSREHAAVAPMFLGVQLVLTKSFARIHLDNLVNAGIPPLTFEDPKSYDGIQQGDRLKVTDLLAAIRAQRPAVIENLTRRSRTNARVNLRPYQREVLLAGGGIRYAQARRMGAAARV